MKINEVLQPSKINEASTFLSLLLGKDIADQYDTEDRHAEGERIFLDDFIRDATVSLRNGIKAGLIDPDKKSPNPRASASETPTDDSTAPEYDSPGSTSSTTPSTPTKESRYHKMNRIFESIMETEEEEGVQSIAGYMSEWFRLYMHGVDWKSKKTIVDSAIKKVEDTYKNDFGKAALEKLGRLAFALSGPAKQLPAGARDINPAASSAFSAASGKKLLTPDQLAGQLAALTPTERAEVLKKVPEA